MGDVISLAVYRNTKQIAPPPGMEASATPASTPAQPVLPGPTAAEMQQKARAKQLEDTKRLAARAKHGTDGQNRW